MQAVESWTEGAVLPEDRVLLRLLAGAAAGLSVGLLLGFETSAPNGDVGLAAVVGGFAGLGVGTIVALFWPGG